MKGRQRRQDVLILTETNSVVDGRLETEIGYAVSSDTVEAWGLNSNQQAADLRDKPGKGGDIQVISERSYKPIQVFELDAGIKDSEVIGQNVNTIASQKEDEAQSFIDRKGSKRNWQLIIMGVVCGILAISVLLKVSLGGGGISCVPNIPRMAALIFSIKSIGRGLSKSKILKVKASPEVAAGASDINNKTELLAPEPSFFSKLRKLKKGHNRVPNCLLFSDVHRSVRDVYISPKHLPGNARRRDYRGRSVFLINVSRKGKLYPISVPSNIVQDESPKDLYIALNCELEVDAVYGMEGTTWEKVKFGILAFIIGIELLVLFVWQSSGV